MSFRYGVESKCSNCGKPVSRDSDRCPHCGVYFSGEKWVGRKSKSKKVKNTPFTLNQIIAIVAVIAVVAVGAFLLFSPSDDSVSEINHVNEISIAVAENDLGFSSVVTYGHLKDGSVTTNYESIYGNQVYVSVMDTSRNVTDEDISKVISGVLQKDDTLVKINETTVGGKYNNYTYITSMD